MNVIFEHTKESLELRMKILEQGWWDKYKPMPVRIIKVEENFEGQLVIYVEVNLRLKNDYELKANSNCRNCKGQAYIRFWLAQDESRVGLCWVCFPDNVSAQQWKKFVEENERYR